MFVPILILALAVPFQSSAKSDTSQGTYLFHACQAAIQEMDHPQSDSPNLAGAMFCMSYFEGFIDGKSAAGHGPCLGDASSEAIVRAYVAYMEKHPKVMEMDKRVGVVLALGSAYPCPATP
jgi:hypothetical protein